jgi:hypothetical protein
MGALGAGIAGATAAGTGMPTLTGLGAAAGTAPVEGTGGGIMAGMGICGM